jgi:alkylation response protein AidB-like acyl-CoA dehydrogenase
MTHCRPESREDLHWMVPREASMAKLFVTETAQKAALEGM